MNLLSHYRYAVVSQVDTAALATDPAVWVALAVRGLLYIIVGGTLADGYHREERIFVTRWEELHLFFVTAAEIYLFVAVVVALVPSGVVPLLSVGSQTAALGVVVAVRYGLLWVRTLADTDTTTPTGSVRLTAMLVTILFGAAGGVYTAMTVHPDASILTTLFRRQVTILSELVTAFQATLGLNLVVFGPVVGKFIEILRNNGQLLVRAVGLGAAGGLVVGVGIPLVMIIGMNAALIFGVFTGTLARNSIQAGNALFGPPLALFAGTGLLVAGHTFHEFAAMLAAGVGAGLVGLGFSKSRSRTIRSGLLAVLFGLAQLVYAAVVETTIDAYIVGVVKGAITVSATIASLPLNSAWAVGVGSTAVTVTAFGVVTAGTIRLLSHTATR